MPPRWRAVDPDQLLWESWEDTHAVFCRTTGETHLVNELPAEVLRELGKSPHSVDELAKLLAARCGVEDSDAWHRKIATVVEGLRLVELLSESP